MSGKKKKLKFNSPQRQPVANDGLKQTKKETLKSGYLKHLIAILVITTAVYFPSLKNEFTNYDDQVYVTDNQLLSSQSPDKLQDIITTPVAGNYHPITMFTLAFNYNISELNPYSYHVLSLVFHILNTLLVFFFVRMLFKGRSEIALITALFFGIHPMHVESVAWVSERKDVVYTFFFLIGLMSYMKYIENKKILFYLAALILMFLSGASKPAAVVFPLILFIIDYLMRRDFNWKVVAEKLPFFAVSVLFGMLTINAQQAEGISEFEKYNIVQRIMFASYGFVMYLVKMLVPTGLSVMHPYPKMEDGLPAAYAISTLVAVGLGVLTFLSYKKTKVVIFGMLFYLFSLILVLQFMSVGRAIIAERYTYLAYIGPFILIGYAFNRIINDKTGKLTKYSTLAKGVLILYCGAMTYTCFERTKIWKNPETMWTDAISKYPDDWFAYMGRANWYIDNNDYQKSFADYNKIVLLKPDKADAYVGRGNVFRRNNQLQEALKDYNKALSLDSSKASGFNDRGSVYFDLGQDELALADFNRALSMKPDLYQTYNNMGSVYARKGDYETALKNYGKALELNPRYADSYLNRGILFTLRKESVSAQKDFETYFGIIKDKAVHKAYYWNGVNEQNQKQITKAVASLSNAISLSPNSGSYYFSRSECYLASGDKSNALKDALKAKELGVNVTAEYLGRLR